MINFKFEKVDVVDSTNDYLMREVDSYVLKTDKILIARTQVNGHGTKGRTFVSKSRKGLYFSFLHFYGDESELKYLTLKVGASIYYVFKNIFGIELRLKWVNDLYYNDKKVCGILCRHMIKHKAVIIGIGIDLFKDDNLDESIKDIAGYIFKDKDDLLDKLNNNKFLSKDSCVYRNVYENFKTLKIDGLFIDDSDLWEPDALVIQIIENIMANIKISGIPSIYIEKNVVKGDGDYEDCDLEC